MSTSPRPAKIRALVVDDELLARRSLTLLLRADADIGSVAECDSGLAAVEEIRTSRPDLVFLDVQMPECDGFDVLELLGNDLPTIIFVTAYDQYALRAFEAGALDYLLKPFDDTRFARALTRAKETIARSAPSQRPAQRLIVRDKGQILFLNIDDIDWIEAAGYYACVHISGTTHIIRRSLADLERDLGDEKFARIHRSNLVNVERISRIEFQNSGDYEVVLRSGVKLPLSRRLRKRLQDRLAAL